MVRTRLRGLVALLGTTLVAGAALAAVTTSPASATAPVSAAAPAAGLPGSSGGPARSCGWQTQVSADELNILYPDQAANYWISLLPIPVGGHIEVSGQFPHARYTSLITYTPQLQAIDGLNDQQILPDAGSSDPFLAGADRTAAARSYTVDVVDAKVPAGARPANTIYTSTADGTKSTASLHLALLALRIYIPDDGTGVNGGVPLPALTLVLGNGQRVALPSCPNLVPGTDINQQVAALGLPIPLPTLGAFGVNPPVWHKFTNTVTGEVTVLTDTGLLGALYPVLAPITDALLPSGGFLENIDNKYIYTTMDAGYGQILVLHGKAPTTPRTEAGEPVMGTGQLRYWSLCTENVQTTGFYGCSDDEQVPVDANGYYTIVISSAVNRPANATAACGFGWLPAGPTPQTLLILRNMLPSPGFVNAIQDVTPGHEKQGMGAYYPVGTYYKNASAFARLGCPAG